MRQSSFEVLKGFIVASLLFTASLGFAQEGFIQRLCRIVVGGSSSASKIDPASAARVTSFWQTHTMHENPNRVVSKNDEPFLE